MPVNPIEVVGAQNPLLWYTGVPRYAADCKSRRNTGATPVNLSWGRPAYIRNRDPGAGAIPCMVSNTSLPAVSCPTRALPLTSWNACAYWSQLSASCREEWCRILRSSIAENEREGTHDFIGHFQERVLHYRWKNLPGVTGLRPCFQFPACWPPARPAPTLGRNPLVWCNLHRGAESCYE